MLPNCVEYSPNCGDQYTNLGPPVSTDFIVGSSPGDRSPFIIWLLF